MIITVPETSIRSIDVRENDQGGDAYATLNLTGQLTRDIRNKLRFGTFDAFGKPVEDWPGENATGGTLKGSLNATALILTPTDKSYRTEYELNLAVNLVTDFKWSMDKDTRILLINYVVRTSDFDSILSVTRYKLRLGRASASARISYAKQANLPGIGDPDPVDDQPHLVQ